MPKGFGRGAVIVGLILSACHEGGLSTPTPPTSSALLSAAIEAHGGVEALSRLDDLHVSSEAVFIRGGIELRRTLDFRAPASLAMEIARDGVPILSFGLAEGRCWRTDRAFVRTCGPEDLHDQERIVDVLNARFLHRIDPTTVRDAGTVLIDGREALAIGTGDLRLAFDPATNLLIQIDYEEAGARWVESYSELESHGGALVARERTLTIDGVPDTTDNWTRIAPGVADPERLAPRDAPVPGDVYDGEDPSRIVAFTDIDASVGATEDERIARGVETVSRVLETNDMDTSGTDGPILELADDGTTVRLALTLEAGGGFEDRVDGAVHIETRPLARYVGIFQRGLPTPAQILALDGVLRARSLEVAPGQSHQLVLAADAAGQPLTDSLGLLRVSVVPGS
jgi:hypothetical protein